MAAVYLDHAAHTPPDPRVVAAMVRADEELPANPHSVGHALGRKAREGVEAARASVAASIGARPEQVVFTSGATEANNLALLGYGWAPKRVLTCATEHASVLGPLAQLEAAGTAVRRVPVDRCGRLELHRLLPELDGDTAMVSLMWVNNELGTVHPVERLAPELRRRGIPFHVDAAQAFGRVPVRVDEVEVDLLTLSAHKMGGPAGIGALYVREPGRLSPRMYGGGQQGGLRPGTLPTPLCVGFGVAAELVRSELSDVAAWLGRCTTELRRALEQRAGPVRFLSPPDAAPGILAAAFDGVAAEDLLALVGDEVALAAGSACTTGSGRQSHVLHALPVPRAAKEGALRLSPGRRTTLEDLHRAVDVLVGAVAVLRGLAVAPVLPRALSTNAAASCGAHRRGEM